MSKKIAILDTNILIWAFKPETTINSDENIFKSTQLIKKLDEEGYTIAITTINVSELLVNVDEDCKRRIIHDMQRFEILPFDFPSSITCSEFLTECNKNKPDLQRNRINPDCQIISIGYENGIREFISNDNHFRKIFNASGLSKTCSLKSLNDFTFAEQLSIVDLINNDRYDKYVENIVID